MSILRIRLALALPILTMALLVPAAPSPADDAFLVRDIDTTHEPWYPGCPILCPEPEPVYGSLIRLATTFGDRVFFVADDRVSGTEPWVSDGTEEGTLRLGDLCPGTCSSEPQFIGAVANGVLFWAQRAPSQAVSLWHTDGTVEGTVELVPEGFCPLGCSIYVEPIDFARGGERFFQFYDYAADAVQLWRTDGTAHGTERVFDFECALGSCFDHATWLVDWQGSVYFDQDKFGNVATRRLAPNGQVLVEFPGCTQAGSPVVFGERLLLFASCEVDGEQVRGLYAQDDPETAPELVTTLPNAKVWDAALLDGALYFLLPHAGGDRLWRTDGTAAGTRQVMTIAGNTVDLYPLPSRLAYAIPSTEPPYASTLWSMSPTGETEILAILTDFVSPSVVGDRLFFPTADAEHGSELWTSDGTVEGTARIADIVPGPQSSTPGYNGNMASGFVALGDLLFFAAHHPDTDIELWATSLAVAPPEPATPSPADGATGVALEADLAWSVETAGDWRFDVYLDAGEGAPQTLVCADLEQPSCALGSDLMPSTAYRWQVVTRDLDGDTTAGQIWRFETGAPPCPASICLGQGRFAVDASFTTAQGAQGSGTPVSYSDETALFWFFAPGNVELVVKVLDGCAISRTFWVFAAGLTDVGVRLTVTDTETGAQRVYDSPVGTAFDTITDTGAFACD